MRVIETAEPERLLIEQQPPTTNHEPPQLAA